jgi:hypothetical protein
MDILNPSPESKTYWLFQAPSAQQASADRSPGDPTEKKGASRELRGLEGTRLRLRLSGCFFKQAASEIVNSIILSRR